MRAEDYIIQWCQSKSYTDENLFVRGLREFLDDAVIAKILECIDDICKHCWNAYGDCQCWNDE